MLQELTKERARQIADFAKAARDARDAILANIPEEALGEPRVARGAHNPIAGLGFDPLPPDASEIAALENAVSALAPLARSELFALMRIGQGDLAAGNWDRGLSEATTLGDETVAAALTENPDLHDHLAKGLFELDQAS